MGYQQARRPGARRAPAGYIGMARRPGYQGAPASYGYQRRPGVRYQPSARRRRYGGGYGGWYGGPWGWTEPWTDGGVSGGQYGWAEPWADGSGGVSGGGGVPASGRWVRRGRQIIILGV